MNRHLKKIISHPLISGSAIVFVGSFGANIFQFLFNFIMVHKLTEVNYGLLTTLMSLVSLLAILQGAFSNIFAKYAAEYHARDDMKAYSAFAKNGLKVVSLIAGVVLIILLVFIFPFMNFLHITDARLLLFVYFSIVTLIVFSLPMGLLQGRMRFYMVSFLNLLIPLLKIILGILFVYLGYQVLGITIGVFIAVLIPLLYGGYVVAKGVSKTYSAGSLQTFFQEFKGYSLRFMLATLGLTVISYLDVVLVRHFFNAEITGQYAAMSLMGKSIFYFTAPIYFVFFPLIAYKREKKEDVTGTLFLSIGIIATISGLLAVFYFLFPHFVIAVFSKPEYQILSPYVGWFAVFIALFSIVNLLNNYFLSIGKTGVYKINLLFAFLFIVLMFSFHTNLYAVIIDLSVTALLLIGTYIVYYQFNGN